MENSSVILGNTEMYYVSFGEGKKKLVVLPGLSDGLTTVKGKAWLLSLPYRKYFRDYTVYMFSRKNDMPEGYSMEDMAEDQVSAMRSLGIEQADLLRWMELAEQGDHTALMTDTAERMYSERYLKKYRKALPHLARFTKPSGYDRFLKNASAILNFDSRSELSKISCPTLIIAGSDDRTVGTGAASELHHGISGSELYVYEGLGHGAFEEAKDFYDRVLEFCNQ